MSAMGFRVRAGRKTVTLSITPLIDVLFLFIIFFVLTGTFKRAGELELQLPESKTSNPAQRTEGEGPLELVVTEEGVLLLNGDGVEMADLKSRLQQVLGEDPSSRVTIKAESGVEHGQVVLLLDIVRDSGFPGVGIGTYLRPGGTGDE